MLSDTISGKVGLAFMALGVVLFALIVLEGLASSFAVIGSCTNADCIAIYDYSPLYLPSFYGAVLFSIGTIMTLLIGPRGGNREESRSGKTIALLLSYGAIPLCVFFLLLSNANLDAVNLSTWTGFPANYVGGCLASLIEGPLPPCRSIIWEGFWIDVLFYTAWGYAIVILTTLIPRLKPPHLAFPELEDITT